MNLVGNSNEAFYDWESLDGVGPFHLLEQIQNSIRKDASAIDSICALPKGVDTYLWQYEHLRQFMIELNALVASIDGICTKVSCPIMKATDEWVFLCAAHSTPKECCAFEYMCHTLDAVSALLCSAKVFPSRVSITENAAHYFQSVARRLYRIFSHTYFHHRQLYDEYETETHLSGRFQRFVKTYNLIPDALLLIPN